MDAETMTERHTHWMERALAEAERAIDEVPIGAVVVRDDTLLAAAFNQPRRSCDPTAHAEIVALREAAAAVGNYRLSGALLVTTLEPCLMCLGAMIHARVGLLVYGARDARLGATGLLAEAQEVPGGLVRYPRDRDRVVTD